MAEIAEGLSYDILSHPNRYWAGRHHPETIAEIVCRLVRMVGKVAFKSQMIDSAVRGALGEPEDLELGKGTRWAYLKVLRDIGLVKMSPNQNYYLTKWAFQVEAGHEDYQEHFVRALFRSFEPNNPVHALLHLFTSSWAKSPEQFVGLAERTTFEKHSENSFWINGPRPVHITGMGKNQFNLIWNGLLPFLEGIHIITRFDGLPQAMVVREYAPIWDWNHAKVSLNVVEPLLREFVRNSFPFGKMVTIPELCRSFWQEQKVGPLQTVNSLRSWSASDSAEIQLIRAPGAVAEHNLHMQLVTDRGAFGAFVRRRLK